LADTERSGTPATLRHMESRDWQYGWAADDPRWTDEPPSASQWGANGNGRLDPEQRQRGQFGAGLEDAWEEPPPNSGPLAVTGPAQPATAVHFPVRPGYGLLARMVGAQGNNAGTAPDTRAERAPRPNPRVRRRRRSNEDEFRRTSLAEIFGDEPRYPALFGLTAAWYALLGLIYLGWLALAGDQGSGNQPLASLPWLATAIALSMAVAALLRWAVVGWRALTLSFAAAIIGAGVATIAHSLAV
jgi:hypothetical protein